MKAGFNSGASLFHPIASAIISCVEKRINFVNRGLYEVKNLQSENPVAEKFAMTTNSRLIEGFMRDFTYLQQDVEVLIPQEQTANLEKLRVFKSELPPRYRLFFSPIDNIKNFARSLADCGTFFCLQSIIPSGESIKYETVFSLFFSFKTQKFLYAEHNGIVSLESKRMKAPHRKTSLVIGANKMAIMDGFLATKEKDFKIHSVIIRESLVSDAFDVASGAIDGIIYRNIEAWKVITLFPLLKSLSCYVRVLDAANKPKELDEKFLNSLNLDDNITIIAGCEGLIKAL